MINYRDLPEAVFDRIAPFYALAFSDTDRETMCGVMRRDAKSPDAEFMPDSQAKRDKATERVRTAADIWLTPVYDKLEALRGSPYRLRDSASLG